MPIDLLQKAAVEFIGTFFLVFTIGMAAIDPGGAGPLAPIAIGAVLIAMIYAGGHVSGAHYNPAVTLAATLRGKAAPAQAAAYVVAQLAAASAAALLVLVLKPDARAAAIAIPLVPALLGELLFTFALVWVILNVAAANANRGNGFYGVAIAFIVIAGVYAVGGISGAAFNPAVVLALGLWGRVGWEDLWIHLAGQVAGAAAAVAAFRATLPRAAAD